MLVNSTDELIRLLRLLRSHNRRVPLVVVTQKIDKSGPVITAMRLQDVIGKTGIVRTLSGMSFAHFNRAEKRFPVYARGVRLYEPLMDAFDAQTRHPFWSEQAIEELGENEFIDLIRNHCAAEAKYRQAGKPPLAVMAQHPVQIPKPKRPLLCARPSDDLELSHSIEPATN